jgi:hypothetical protein
MFAKERKRRMSVFTEIENLVLSEVDSDISAVFSPLRGGKFDTNEPVKIQISKDLNKIRDLLAKQGNPS